MISRRVQSTVTQSLVLVRNNFSSICCPRSSLSHQRSLLCQKRRGPCRHQLV
ncbi:hypothetical protein METSCH_B01470 [Metschnikowia aff. pulcherrima]|uniref:Uncharacterized protein n=1 Tax=Metschnikowia aff. pulcherrima TaxID=2163413 RepID=A0A4P6XKD1_9ASCO|nr:hypothetical protein METSCH_B01470 [Metschnikowia aff. pulcherrima]